MSMDEFKKKGGNLGGQAERTSAFDGCPQGKGVHPDHDHNVKAANTGSASSAGMSSGMSSSGGISGTAAGSKGLHTEEKKQPSLLDRMNPYKDT